MDESTNKHQATTTKKTTVPTHHGVCSIISQMPPLPFSS